MADAAGTRAPVPARRRASVLGAAIPAAFAGLLLCWVLAAPAGPAPASTAGVIALMAGTALVGLGGLPLLGVTPSAVAIGGFAALWLAADLVEIWFDVAARAGESVGSVRVGQFADGVTSAPGELISGVVALTIIVWAVAVRRVGHVVPEVVVGALAALGVAAPAVTGHAVTHAVEPILLVAHALCAAWWCGTLAALAMTVSSRNGWRAALPVFSRYALYVVVVLAATGLVCGAVELGLSAQWVTTGYGRVMIAKALGLAALIGVAARHRRRWVPDVEGRRASAEQSLRAAALEVAAMSVVLGLAAGLASTSPVG